MAKSRKVSMPSSMGGLVRYFDDYKSKIEITPGIVIVMIIIVVIFMVFLHSCFRVTATGLTFVCGL